MCELGYKASLPKATSGLLGPCWEQRVLGSLLAGKRKNLAGVSFSPSCPVIKKEEGSASSWGRGRVSQGP